jgi:hypothetical protein
LAVLALNVCAFAQIPADKVRAELDRLTVDAAKVDWSTPEAKDSKPSFDGALARAKAALDYGRAYQALEEISRVRRALAGAKNPPASSVNLTGFEADWKKASVELPPRVATRPVLAKSPAAIRALAEAAVGETPVLVEASRAYASVTDASAGYYYIGQAKADVEELQFLTSLNVAEKRKYSYHSILPELQKLQSQVIAAFQPPRSIDKHPDFIRLNSTLKRAFELDASKLYAGAMHQYLSSVQQLGMMEMTAPEGDARDAVRKKLEALATELARANSDSSLAELYVQRGLAQLDSVESTADNWKTANVILSQVIPAYSEALASNAKPQDAKKLITVTLVRWPYT